MPAHPTTLPRLTVIGLLQLALGSVWLIAMSHVAADPDLWGHVRFGQDMIAHRAVRLADTYSFTTDRAWINHEWLAELMMAGAYSTLGALGLNVVRFGVIAIVLAIVWREAERLAARHRITLVAAAALGISLRAYPVRPQLFSLVGFALLLRLLSLARQRDSIRPMLLTPLVMAVWANMHGGWIVGLATIGAWTTGALVSGERPYRSVATFVAVFCLAALATLATPYGVDLWRFIATTVRADRPQITDWLPVYSLPPSFWGSWLVALGMTVFTVLRARSNASKGLLLVTLGLGVASVRVSRLDAFFAISSAFLVASAFSETRTRIEEPVRGSPFVGVVGLVAALAVSVISIYRATRIEIREQLAPEPEAVVFFLDHHLQGRVLSWFGWGEYAIWHLGSHDLKVSIDGRRETVYSDEVVNRHLEFYFSSVDAGRYPTALNADYIWLPVDLPVVTALPSAGWRAVFQGARSIVFARQSSDLAAVTVRTQPLNRAFPGP